jgi:hypothetical protein
MMPSRDYIIAIAAVAWWRADPADLRTTRPPNEYAHYAIRFADAYREGEGILECVREINRRSEFSEESNRMIAELIHFGFYQWDYLAPDAAELDARDHVTDE